MSTCCVTVHVVGIWQSIDLYWTLILNILLNLYRIIRQLFKGYGPPANIWALGTQQFMRNLNAMLGEYKDEDDIRKY